MEVALVLYTTGHLVQLEAVTLGLPVRLIQVVAVVVPMEDQVLLSFVMLERPNGLAGQLRQLVLILFMHFYLIAS